MFQRINTDPWQKGSLYTGKKIISNVHEKILSNFFTDIVGPANVDGMETCPSPSYKYSTSCCCGGNCCWGNCRWSTPPQDCIQGIPNAKWVYDAVAGYFKVMTLGPFPLD